MLHSSYPQDHDARRARVMEAMGHGSALVLLSGHEKLRSRDTDYRFRADSDVVYLTGFEEPEAVLVLTPGRPQGAMTLFVRPRDAEKEIWTGRRFGVEGAKARFGADEAWNLDELDAQLPKLLEGIDTLYYSLGVDEGFDRRMIKTLQGLRSRRGLPPAAPKALKDARELIHPFRWVKSEDELAILRRACAISAEAHVAAMRACKPGCWEYELEAVLEGVFRRHGCPAPSYGTIVGAGQNATILHYTENQSQVQAGDLVLIDAGAEFRCYAGDITRTFPASGRFSPVQRDLYQAVLEAEIAGIEMCVPGATWLQIHEATLRRLTQSMVDLGLLLGDVDGLIESKAYQKFYMHKTGHYLGMDVHDVGPYFEPDGSAKRLVPGVVQTIEPGIYIQPNAPDVPEHFWGIGVRIEDDVLTTADGFEVLTGGVPKTIEAIEALVGADHR